MPDQLIPATITVADRSYRIKIHPKDEEVVRKTVKTINDKIIEFRTQFAGKDMQDYIAMVLIWYATEQHAGTAAGIVKDNLSEQLENIEKLLDAQLKGDSKTGA
jgi:cell division protein ZapA (FtsZ GTPase activity inhibitor)